MTPLIALFTFLLTILILCIYGKSPVVTSCYRFFMGAVFHHTKSHPKKKGEGDTNGGLGRKFVYVKNRNMKYILLLLLIASCKGKDETGKEIRQGLQILTIGGCEYVLYIDNSRGSSTMVHHAVCKNHKNNVSVQGGEVFHFDTVTTRHIWVLMLLKAIGTEVRNLGDVKWLATEDRTTGKGTGRHIACFILKPMQ